MDETKDSLIGTFLQLNPAAPVGRAHIESLQPDEFELLLDSIESMAIEDIAKARAWAMLALDVASHGDHRLLQARTQRTAAHVLAYANELSTALELLNESVEICEQAHDEVAGAHALMALLHVHNRLGQSDLALEVGSRACTLFKAHGEQMLAARADANLGIVQRMRNEPAKALVHFEQATAVIGHIPVAAAQLTSNRAEALLDLHRFEESERAFLEALKAFETADLKRAQAIVLGNLADLMGRQGRLRDSFAFFERARSLMDDAAPGDLARIDAEEAEVLMTSGDWRTASTFFDSALHQLDASGLAWEACRSLISHAHCQVKLGNFDRAIQMIDGAVSRAEEMHAPQLGHFARILRAELDLLNGRLPEAEAGFVEALDLVHDRPLLRIRALAGRSRVASKMRAHDVALEIINQAIESCGSNTVAPMDSELLRARAETYAHLNQRDNAIEDYTKAIAGIDRIRCTIQANRIRATYLGSLVSAYEQFITLLIQMPNAHDARLALEVSEMMRSRVLLDHVAQIQNKPDQHLSSSTSDSDTDVATLTKTLNALYSRLHDNELRGTVDSELLDIIQIAESRLDSAERQLQTVQGANAMYSRPLTAQKIIETLPAHVTLAEFCVIGNDVHAIVVNGDDIQIIPAIARVDQVQSQIGRMYFEFARRRFGQNTSVPINGPLQALYTMLIEPLVKSIGAIDALHVVAHGLLHAIPFHALIDRDGEPLLATCPITTTPSASLIPHLRRSSPQPRQDKMVLYAVADANAPQILEEAETIEQTMSPDVCRVNGACMTAQLDTDVLDATLLHIAAHGRFSVDRPLSSGVRLHDRWLTSSDILNLRLPQALVVLSGCATGQASVDAADEVYGLIRGVFASGAATLMCSLWDVDDHTCALFMNCFYQHYRDAENRSAAKSWRHACLTTARFDSDPFLWAPFVLHGAPDDS